MDIPLYSILSNTIWHTKKFWCERSFCSLISHGWCIYFYLVLGFHGFFLLILWSVFECYKVIYLVITCLTYLLLLFCGWPIKFSFIMPILNCFMYIYKRSIAYNCFFAGIDVLIWGGNKWISTYCCGIKWLNSFEDI